MILPTVTSLATDAIAAVPDSYRDGSYGLGCTRWQTIVHVEVPSAMQQATRVSSHCAFFYLGEMVECAPTAELFTRPRDKRTEDYLTGRFG